MLSAWRKKNVGVSKGVDLVEAVTGETINMNGQGSSMAQEVFAIDVVHVSATVQVDVYPVSCFGLFQVMFHFAGRLLSLEGVSRTTSVHVLTQSEEDGQRCPGLRLQRPGLSPNPKRQQGRSSGMDVQSPFAYWPATSPTPLHRPGIWCLPCRACIDRSLSSSGQHPLRTMRKQAVPWVAWDPVRLRDKRLRGGRCVQKARRTGLTF